MQILDNTATMRDDNTVVQSDDNLQYFAAEDLEIDSDFSKVLVAKSIIINAINVRITSDLALSGATITIFCRSLEVDGQRKIDVSGMHGSQQNLPAKSGSAQGEDGIDGANGLHGKGGGSIVVICENLTGGNILALANGGDGASGQDGGDGAVGIPAEAQTGLFDFLKELGSHKKRNAFMREHLGYPKGKKFIIVAGKQKLLTKNYAKGRINGLPGNEGGKGGDSGKGGSGGNGGKGGEVTFYTSREFEKHLQFAVNGGVLGNGGKNGQPGKGGPKGVGGPGLYIQPVQIFNNNSGLSSFNFGPRLSIANGAIVRPAKSTDRKAWGSDGPTGKDGIFPPKPASGITATSGRTSVLEVSQAPLADVLTPEFIELALQSTKTRFIENDPISAGSLAAWIEGICGQVIKQLTPDSPDVGRLIRSQAEAQAILNKRRLGLNYFGHNLAYAPRLSFETYRERISEQILQIRRLDDDFAKLRQGALDHATGMDIAKKLVDGFTAQINQRTSAVNSLQNDATANDVLIAELLEKSNDYSGQLFEADIDFRKAVERRARCSFGDILTAVSSIVAIATGVGAVAGAFSLLNQANEKASEPPKDGTAKVKPTPWLEKVAKVTGSIKGVKDKYDALKVTLKAQRDSAIMIMNKEDFDKQLGKFSDVPEAKKYKTLMTEFIETNNLRNQSIIKLAEIRQNINSINVEISKIKAEQSRILAEKAEDFTPEAATIALTLKGLLDTAKYDVLENLELQRRGHRYWSLNDPQNIDIVGELSSEDLELIQFNVGEVITRAQEVFSSDRKPLEHNTFRFTRDEFPEKFATLDKAGTFSFNISSSTNQFPLHSRVFIDQVKVNVRCATTSNEICWLRLLHSGNAEVLDSKRRRFFFTHKPLITQGQNRLDSTFSSLQLLDETSKYVGVSPFTDWVLRIEHFEDSIGQKVRFSPRSHLARISEILVSFEGDYTPAAW